MGNPLYRGIYAYDDTNKPAAPAKASPKYRGIYAYDDTAVTVAASKKGDTDNASS